MKKQSIDLLAKYLSGQHLLIDTHQLMKDYAAIPSFPSLFALIQSLKSFGVVLAAVSMDRKALSTCSEKVLLYLEEPDDRLVIFKGYSDNEIYYADSSGIHTMSQELNEWKGIVLYLEGVDEEKQNVLKKKQKEAVWNKVVTSVFLAIFCIGLLYAFAIQSVLGRMLVVTLLWVKLAGMVVILSLVKQGIGISGNIENRLCRISRAVDCRAVLDSPASKLFTRFSFSDIGFVYFVGGFLLLLVLGVMEGKVGEEILSFLQLLSFCSIPYILFSVFYQLVVVKKVCLFCLFTVLLLMLEVVCFVCMKKVELKIDIPIGLCLTAFFVLLYQLLMYVKYKYNSYKQLENVEFECMRIKRDEDVFKALLSKQADLIQNENPVCAFLGNPNGSIRLTVVLSLYCTGCANLFRRITFLMNTSSEDFCVQLNFVSNEMSEDIVAFLFACYEKKGEVLFLKVLNEWYTSHQLERLEAICPSLDVPFYKGKLSLSVEAHKKWEESNHINHIPFVFVNGKVLPRTYQIEDLIYFVD